MSPRWLIALASLGFFPACIGGPCVHTYEEDVLFLDAVYDADTGAMLDEVVITELRLEGSTRNLQGERLTPLGDGAAICTLPCSFGTNIEGTYEIDISADGYEATTVVAIARYANEQSSCPSSSDGGTRTIATLDAL